MSYPDARINTTLEEGTCYHVDRVAFRMLRGPDKLAVQSGDYDQKRMPALSADKTDIVDALRGRSLTVCSEKLADFARKRYPIQAYVKNQCAINARVRVRVRIQEIAAFLLPEPSHVWEASDTEFTWDMEQFDEFYLDLAGAIPPKFGTLGPFRLRHTGGFVILDSKWTGPRSLAVFESNDHYFECSTWVSATPETPVTQDLFFSSPYADCVFDEDCGGVFSHPLSDNFNNLPWKNFWDFRTYSPATSFPIGSWIVMPTVECLGPVD